MNCFYSLIIFNFLLLSTSWSLTFSELSSRWHNIHNNAIEFAGEPEDIEQRVMLLREIYLDSRGNHRFPLVAAHGAIWAMNFFNRLDSAQEITLDQLEKLASELGNNSLKEFQIATAEYKTQMLIINRQVFIDTYTNYFFSKNYGHNPLATQFIQPDLLLVLNTIHQASEQRILLTVHELKKSFITSLVWEQEQSVAPLVEMATKDYLNKMNHFNFGDKIAHWSMKPVVRFSYFPRSKYLFFNNISDKKERVNKAIESYDIGQSVGFEKVLEEL